MILTKVNVDIYRGRATFFGIKGDGYFDDLENQIGETDIYAREVAGLPVAPVIIDVGANIGVTTMIAARHRPNGRIIAIEPSQNAFACLSKTIIYNGVKSVTLINKALGAEPIDEMPFIQSDFLAGSYVGIDASAAPTGFVEMTTLDLFADELNLDRLDLIKIDVEGFELDVLRGGERTIERFKPKIFMEFNSFAIAANRNISPRSVTDYVLDRFGSFSVTRDGSTTEIKTQKEARDFLFYNMAMLTQHIDDIVFRKD